MKVTLFLQILEITQLPSIQAKYSIDEAVIDQLQIFNAMSAHDYQAALKGALRLLGSLADPLAFAVDLGKSIPLTSAGEISLAMRLAPTVRDVIDLLKDFLPLILPGTALSAAVDARDEVVLSVSFGKEMPTISQQLITIAGVLSLSRELSRMTGRMISYEQLKLDGRYEWPMQLVRESMNCAVTTSSAGTQIVFSKAVLSLENPFSDAVTFRSIRSDFQKISRAEAVQNLSVTERVQRILSATGAYDTPLERVADAMCISPRQFRYALKKEGISFRKLVMESRMTAAADRLLDSDVSISTISEDLGFSDVSAFSKSFKEWSGKAPSVYRKSARYDKAAARA